MRRSASKAAYSRVNIVWNLEERRFRADIATCRSHLRLDEILLHPRLLLLLTIATLRGTSLLTLIECILHVGEMLIQVVLLLVLLTGLSHAHIHSHIWRRRHPSHAITHLAMLRHLQPKHLLVRPQSLHILRICLTSRDDLLPIHSNATRRTAVLLLLRHLLRSHLLLLLLLPQLCLA